MPSSEPGCIPTIRSASPRLKLKWPFHRRHRRVKHGRGLNHYWAPAAQTLDTHLASRKVAVLIADKEDEPATGSRIVRPAELSDTDSTHFLHRATHQSSAMMAQW